MRIQTDILYGYGYWITRLLQLAEVTEATLPVVGETKTFVVRGVYTVTVKNDGTKYIVEGGIFPPFLVIRFVPDEKPLE